MGEILWRLVTGCRPDGRCPTCLQYMNYSLELEEWHCPYCRNIEPRFGHMEPVETETSPP